MNLRGLMHNRTLNMHNTIGLIDNMKGQDCKNNVAGTVSMVYPMWIIGPSGPTGKPHPTAATQEKNFTASVFTLNIWRTMVPLRNPVTSGIPEPAALGRKNCANKNKSWIFHCFVIHFVIILWWWNSILLSIQSLTHHNNEGTEYNENQTVCNSHNTGQSKIIVLKLKKNHIIN